MIGFQHFRVSAFGMNVRHDGKSDKAQKNMIGFQRFSFSGFQHLG